MAERKSPWLLSRDEIQRLHAERRNDEWGDGGELDDLTASVMEREGLLGECLHRFRLALTATFLGNHEETEAVLSAAIALLVEHDIVDPTEP